MHLALRCSRVWVSIRRFRIIPRSPRTAGTVSGVELFEELLKQIVRQCVKLGLVQGESLSVDGSVEPKAAKEVHSTATVGGSCPGQRHGETVSGGA
jgi:hypothetical protein